MNAVPERLQCPTQCERNDNFSSSHEVLTLSCRSSLFIPDLDLPRLLPFLLLLSTLTCFLFVLFLLSSTLLRLLPLLRNLIRRFSQHLRIRHRVLLIKLVLLSFLLASLPLPLLLI